MGREHSIGASNKSRLAGRNPLRRFVLRSVLPFATLLLVLVLAFFRLQAIKPVTDASRALNKRFGNPAMMRLAGRRARGDRAGDRVAFVAAAGAAFVRPCGDRAVPEAEEALGAFLGNGRLRR